MTGAPDTRQLFERILSLLEAMEENQRQKVLSLARRLLPGLTPEDIRNPHDFPDLDDPDWHFEDGQLTGIQSVRFALRALSGEVLSHGDQGASRADEHQEDAEEAEQTGGR
ncbi:hypothetical protein [Polyangium fumosum]|uniref:Uncharacterized protein n=1 Tax=Polyangium fumosum TaxID=889272 RepID=A0A4U1IVK5_9BACT|nr:hypothetical protein [Polyangium fumosum]TKC98536.1 hypothetical protein E8A74_40985 [Polyangium fumosum]